MANGTFELGQINITSPNGLVTKPISIDNNGKPLFDNIQLASTVNPTFTGNVTLPSTTTINSKLLANSLLAEYTVTGSAVTSIDFSGLDINTHKSYRVEIEFLNVGSYSNIYCYVNNDTTPTNYYGQFMGANAGAVTAARNNDPRIVSSAASTNSSAICYINLVNNNFFAHSDASYGVGSGVEKTQIIVSKTATVTNITQLTFTASIANSIGVGSTIRLYRGDV